MECGLLVGDGPFRRLTVAEAEAYRGSGFLWLHLHGKDEDDIAVLKRQDHIPDVAATALLATETRPRCDRIAFGALVNLRGPGEIDPDDSDRLVSIRLWVHDNRVTSVSRRRMTATREVMRQVEAGEILDPGDLVAGYARAISAELDPQVSGLGDRLDDIESDLEDPKTIYRHRRTITSIRADAIAFRRFVAPDRDALLALAEMNFDWLGDDDRVHLREAANKFARMAEELEAVRERAALLHEQITDLRAEQQSQRGLEISVIAFIFLPLTFITGLLGMNVEGIPYATHPLAFWGVVAFCIVVAMAVGAYFVWRHWLHERELLPVPACHRHQGRVAPPGPAQPRRPPHRARPPDLPPLHPRHLHQQGAGARLFHPRAPARTPGGAGFHRLGAGQGPRLPRADRTPSPLIGADELAAAGPLVHNRREGCGGVMKHYRVNKLAKRDGIVVKTKDMLANNDREAMQAARADVDCPICDVLQAGKKVGSVL